MAKGKAAPNTKNISIALYVFLLAALGTYFLPIVSVNLPALGKKSWSVSDVVSVIPKSMPQKQEKKQELSTKYDFMDLVKEISPKKEAGKGTQVSPQLILGALVPVSLALAYVFVIISLLITPLKKGAAFVITTLVATGCSAYALVGVYWLASESQRAFASSMAKVADSPFSAIAKNFVQQVSIQAETGLYALVILAALALVAGIYRNKQTA